MNLYKIIFSHHSPKDSEFGIKNLVLAENDEQVYEWLATEPDNMYNSWKENEKITWCYENDFFKDSNGYESSEGWWDDEDCPELFKDRMFRLKGEIDDSPVDFSDAYYGITLYGWELLKEDVVTDYFELIELGLIVELCGV